MKRIFLAAAAMFALLQMKAQTSNDSSGFKSRKLKLEEVNLVSSYYQQDGNNAAVTGGIGSQQLTDLATVIDVKLSYYDRKARKHTYILEAGLDHYTSASSDQVDLKANSSASHADNRFYPSLNWSVTNEAKGSGIGVGLAYSNEYDYESKGVNINLSRKTKNKSGEFSAKFQVFLDQVRLIAPIELRSEGDNNVDQRGSSKRNTYTASLSYSQIVNKRLQVALLADLVSQQGYLSLPFHRVYVTDGSVRQERLPDRRLKVPIGLRANYFLGDRFILRAYYRFYRDDWALTSHTANFEVPIKITSFFSVSPFYRYYRQSAARYFAGFQKHPTTDIYRTSNYDLSTFNSNFFGAGIRLSPPKGLLGIAKFAAAEIRYGHYSKSVDLNADIISLNLTFK